MKKRLCPNCGCELYKKDSVFIRTGRVQMMKEVLHSGFAADVYCCPSCGKLELYQPEQRDASTPGTAQRTCPTAAANMILIIAAARSAGLSTESD